MAYNDTPEQIKKIQTAERQQLILRNVRKLVEKRKRETLEALSEFSLDSEFDSDDLIYRLNDLNRAINDLDIDEKRSRQGILL